MVLSIAFIEIYSLFLNICIVNMDDSKAELSRRIEGLIATINDDPNVRHRQYTPSVDKLVAIGDAAIAPALDLMLKDDQNTRLRAVTVIRDIMELKYGFVPGKGWVRGEDEKRFKKFWSSLGNLDWDSSEMERKKSVQLWKSWLGRREKGRE